MQSRLNLLGIRRFKQIAAWKATEVNLINQSLGFAGRIEQENWIEQAQILSNGGETDYSRRQRTPDAASSVPPPSPTPSQPPPASPAPPSAQQPKSADAPRPFGVAPQTAAAVTAAVAATAEKQPAATTIIPANADRLHRILGINADVERLLMTNGVTRFAQIASWSPADIERFDILMGRPGRIAKENWVEQAKVLARSSTDDTGQPRPVRLEDAIRDQSARPGDAARAPRADYSNLRSVRSEALRSDVAGTYAGRGAGALDDLKRIRGVGVLIEKKLNSLGVTSYDQVANWTGADIDRISQILDFKGRIERENWVEQARILAAGGQTEFSRRVDRGEVETSRPVR